jgi:hypothetical protein
MCAPGRGERIDTCGVGAVTTAVVLAGVVAGAWALVALLLALPPQPLTMRASIRLKHSEVVLRAARIVDVIPVVALMPTSRLRFGESPVSISDSRRARILPVPADVAPRPAHIIRAPT